MINVKAKINLKSNIIVWDTNFYYLGAIIYRIIFLQKCKFRALLLKILILKSSK